METTNTNPGAKTMNATEAKYRTIRRLDRQLDRLVRHREVARLIGDDRTMSDCEHRHDNIEAYRNLIAR